jgi:hypothetical protein
MEKTRFVGVVKWLMRAASCPNFIVPKGTLEAWESLADQYGADLLGDAVRKHAAKYFPSPKQVQFSINLIIEERKRKQQLARRVGRGSRGEPGRWAPWVGTQPTSTKIGDIETEVQGAPRSCGHTELMPK